MIAYLLLGTGVALLFGSVLYTYKVDRRVNSKLAETDLEARITRNSESEKPFAQMIKTAQVKESIGSIGKDLDVLIDELKEKEAEVKQIVKKVKGWQSEIATTVVEEPTVENESEVVVKTDEPVGQDNNDKYEQIIRLLDQGCSTEEVARTLNLGQREVELVAKVRKKGAKVGA